MKEMRESLERIGSKNRKGRNEARVIHQGVLDTIQASLCSSLASILSVCSANELSFAARTQGPGPLFVHLDFLSRADASRNWWGEGSSRVWQEVQTNFKGCHNKQPFSAGGSQEDRQRGVEMMEAPSSLLLLHFSVCEPQMLHERSPTIRAHSEESHACITAAITTSSHYPLTWASCCLKRPHPWCQQGALWGQPAVSQLIENRN